MKHEFMVVSKAITTKREYKNASQMIDVMMGAAKLNKFQRNYLDLLVVLVIDYENRTYQPVPLPTVAEAIRFRMEQDGLSQSGLANLVGTSKSRISEILAGKRDVSVNLLRAFHSVLGISAEVLLQERPSKASSARRTGVRHAGKC